MVVQPSGGMESFVAGVSYGMDDNHKQCVAGGGGAVPHGRHKLRIVIPIGGREEKSKRHNGAKRKCDDRCHDKALVVAMELSALVEQRRRVGGAATMDPPTLVEGKRK